MASTLMTRSITGVIFAAVMISGTFFSSWTFLSLYFLITIFCLWEYASLVLEVQPSPFTTSLRRSAAVILGMLPFPVGLALLMYETDLAQVYGMPASSLIIGTLLSVFLLFVFELFARGEKPFENVAKSLLGMVYIGIPFSLMPLLAIFPGEEAGSIVFEPWLALGLLFII